LVHQLLAASANGALDEALGHSAQPHLLIVDEHGYLPLERQVGHLLFHLLHPRY